MHVFNQLKIKQWPLQHKKVATLNNETNHDKYNLHFIILYYRDNKIHIFFLIYSLPEKFWVYQYVSLKQHSFQLN